MTRILAIALAAVLLVSVALGFGLHANRAALAESVARVTALEAEVSTQKSLVLAADAAAKARATATAKNAKQRLKEQHALATALAKHPAWASEPVPADVSGSLGVQYRANPD